MESKSHNVELTEYDHLLYNIIQNLDKYTFHEGTEGRSYFIDEKYIVKEYRRSISVDPSVFDSVFDSYCQELNRFADIGYSVPKFYSWLKIPNIDRKKDVYGCEDLPCRYYILQERVPGRWMYYDIDEFKEIYDLCKDICFHDDLLRIMADSSYGGLSLRTEILKKYISDYIMMNEMIESMPAGEFEKFVISVYNLKMNGQYSHPDLFRKNILVDQSRISLIDNRIQSPKDFWLQQVDSVEGILNELILLFELNKSLEDNQVMDQQTMIQQTEISSMLARNKKLCVAVMQKIVSVFKNQIQMEPIRYRSSYWILEKNMRKILNEDAYKVLKSIPTDFEK